MRLLVGLGSIAAGITITIPAFVLFFISAGGGHGDYPKSRRHPCHPHAGHACPKDSSQGQGSFRRYKRDASFVLYFGEARVQAIGNLLSSGFIEEDMRRDPCPKIPDAVKRNIGSIAQLEQELLRQRSAVSCFSDRMTNLIASPIFLAAHALWLIAWILVNTRGISGFAPFDPFPFSLLALCLASETICLTAFVLMSQRRQTRSADQWAHVGLQIGLLAEQETTKMLALLQSMCNQLGLKVLARDRELKEMIQTTPIVAIVQELEKAREANEPTHPKSEADQDEDLLAA